MDAIVVQGHEAGGHVLGQVLVLLVMFCELQILDLCSFYNQLSDFIVVFLVYSYKAEIFQKICQVYLVYMEETSGHMSNT